MSSPTNKRPHEDTGNSTGNHNTGHGHTTILKYPHDDLSAYPSGSSKLTSLGSSEYHASYDLGQDPRMSKIARTESRDPDRKSPLVPMFRMSSSANDSYPDFPAGSDRRLDLRDSRDTHREHKIENRETKAESRELHQGPKVDKEMKFEGRVDDNKESKNEKDNYSESKGDGKPEKDAYAAASSQLNWKDSKEQHRVKRYPDASGGNVDPWHASRTIVHGPDESGKEGLNAEEKDYQEAREAVGENKIELKGEDKFKDKDKRRKEGKHREWGDPDKERNDRRSNWQLGISRSENKDLIKEERDVDRWDREGKDHSKDKEKSKDREKEYMKREAWNGAEKEASLTAKETLEVSGRAVEQEHSVSEQKKQKVHESCKNVDRDGKDRKKEREREVDGERSDKYTRYHDKESDDGVDADGGTDRERDSFSYGVQQRKRMLRPRGSPHAHRDPRFRSRSQDNEVPQGKPDLSTVVYRVGECMQVLIKLWEEYESSQTESVSGSNQNGPTLEIRIPAEHVSATNRQVRGGQLWGTDIYTNDSDLVAVLMHTGYCRPTASPPPSTIQELRATIRVLPPLDCYVSTLRNNVRSRAWGSAIGCSYRVERCCIVKKGGGTIDLEPCLTQSSTLEPTLAPVAVERTMTTRAAASNALRQQRFVREVTVQFNLCHEPWLKYSISVVADKGLKKPLFTSSRLKLGEVLYLETHARRYELCFNGEQMVKASADPQTHVTEGDKLPSQNLHSTNGERNAADSENVVIDVFRFSRCKKPLPQKRMRSIGIPLPLEHVEVLEDNLEWDDIQWSQTGVWIAGKEYQLARAHFLSQN